MPAATGRGFQIVLSNAKLIKLLPTARTLNISAAYDL